jgi:hypothetical protein
MGYTAQALQSPLAQRGYSQIARATLPKTAGFKPIGGIKGGAVGIGSELLGNYLKPKEDPIISGGQHGDFLDKYQRRLQTAGPGILGGAVKGAGQGAQYGGWYGAGAGAVIGGAYGAAKKHAKTAYSDFTPEGARGAITDAYRKYLGRDPEAGVVEQRLASQGWKRGDKGVGQKQLLGMMDEIQNSPEAMQRTPGGGINTAPRAPINFSPSPIPSSFLSPEKVQMLDESRRRQHGY